MNESLNAAIADADRALISAKHASLVLKLGDAMRAPSATSFDAVLDVLEHMETEAQLSLPNVMELQALSVELQNTIVLRLEQAAQDIARTRDTATFEFNTAEEAVKLQEITAKIASLAAKKVAQITAMAAALNAEVSRGSPPPRPPIDNAQGSGDDGRMEARLSKLESDVAAIKVDVAVIKANGATKSDIAELQAATKADIAELKSATKADIAELKSATKADIAELKSATKADIAQVDSSLRVVIAEAKTAIILWVVGAIILAQLLPAILKLLPELVDMLRK